MRAILISIIFLIVGVLLIAGCSSPGGNRRDFPGRDGMPNWEDMPNREGMNRTNFNLDDESKAEVTEFFDNAQSEEEVSEYCAEHMMECGYYCRQINPDNNLCSIIPQRDRPPVNRTRPELE